MGNLEFESQSRQEDFFISKTLRLDLWALPASTGVIASGVKRPQREVNHLYPRHAKVRNEWSYTSSPPICLHCVDRLFFVLCSHNSKHFKVWCLCCRHLINDMTSKGKPEGKRHKTPGHRWKSNTKIVVKKYDVRLWTGCTLFGIGPNGDVFWTW